MGWCFNTSKIHHFLLLQSSAPGTALTMEKQKRNSMPLPSPGGAGRPYFRGTKRMGFALEITGLNPKLAPLSLITIYSHISSSYKVEMTLHSLNFREVKKKKILHMNYGKQYEFNT